VYESPPSVYKAGRDAPQWYARLVMPTLAPIRLELPGARIEVIPDASRATLDAWDDLTHLLMLGGAFFVLVNVLVFWFVTRSMRPMEEIQRKLGDMEGGRLDARLPDFRLPEFQRIGIAFNRMTRALQDAMRDNRRLALAARQSSDAILIHEPDGRISFWNPAAERLFGHRAQDIVGKPLAVLASPAHQAEIARHLESVARRETIDNVSARRLARDGREIDVALTVTPLVDPDTERVVGGIVTHRDLASQIRAQAAETELEQNRELAQLVRARIEDERRGIAQELHDELGQCVTAIRSIAESIVQRAPGDAPEVRAAAQSIKDIAMRIYDGMHSIVRRLRPAELGILGLAETLRSTLGAWAARNPRIDFELALEGELDSLGEAVNIAVYRVVHEALTNIVRHAEATRAWLRLARTDDGSLLLSIRDNGHGHVSLATSAVGLGLIGMRERVEALGGTLSVEGRPGTGTELRAVIPLAAG
jgi:two-component system, NarL family, sensor histidine kinase UhpB